MDSLERLAALSPGIRQDLLRVLTAPDGNRARLVGELFARADSRSLADVLIELEGDELMRLQVIELLEELSR
jgi:hypothetical protein